MPFHSNCCSLPKTFVNCSIFHMNLFEIHCHFISFCKINDTVLFCQIFKVFSFSFSLLFCYFFCLFVAFVHKLFFFSRLTFQFFPIHSPIKLAGCALYSLFATTNDDDNIIKYSYSLVGGRENKSGASFLLMDIHDESHRKSYICKFFHLA